MRKILSTTFFALTFASIGLTDDLAFGGSRMTGAAGAGLALPSRAGQIVFNPAVFARGRSFKFFQPNFDYYVRGFSLGELRDQLEESDQTGLDLDSFGDFAREFADGRSEFGFGADLGLALGTFFIGGSGEVFVNTVPNADLQEWSDQGEDIDDLDLFPDSRLDGYGIAYRSIDLGFGFSSQSEDGHWDFGIRTRSIRAYYSHYIADENSIQNGDEGTLGPEMGGDDVREKSGLAADFGLIYTPATQPKLHLGLVVANLVSPGVDFRSEREGFVKTVDPFERTISFGAAYVPSHNVTLALDYEDFGNRAGRAALRAGASYELSSSFGFSAGYDTREAWTVGVSVFGINISLLNDQRIALARSVRF